MIASDMDFLHEESPDTDKAQTIIARNFLIITF